MPVSYTHLDVYKRQIFLTVLSIEIIDTDIKKYWFLSIEIIKKKYPFLTFFTFFPGVESFPSGLHFLCFLKYLMKLSDLSQ